MICPPCKDAEHGDCRGGNWCDCQHRERGGRWIEEVYDLPVADEESQAE